MAHRLVRTDVFQSRRVGFMLAFGFASGLPLALTSGTLQAWLTIEGADIRLIGFFTLAGLPYALKFLWAPFLDRFKLPWLDRRRGWMLITQIALAVGLAAMAMISPAELPWLMGAVAMGVAFVSASQDIVTDAYRTDVLKPDERGAGAGIFVGGYRIAMQVSGALALTIAAVIGWQVTYWIMAALMGIGIIATLLAPSIPDHIQAPRDLASAYREPFHELSRRRYVLVILLLIVLYKLGDAFAGSLTTTFLLRGPGFSLGEVGIANILGFVATLVGLMLGGMVMSTLGLFRSLLWFGILQAVSNLTFIWLALAGKSYAVLGIAVLVEHLAGGMGTAAFVTLLMSLCDHRYTASQYALLSAFAAFGRIFVGPVSGFLVFSMGWVIFFALTFLLALPGLAVLWWLRAEIDGMETGADNARG